MRYDEKENEVQYLNNIIFITMFIGYNILFRYELLSNILGLVRILCVNKLRTDNVFIYVKIFLNGMQFYIGLGRR